MAFAVLDAIRRKRREAVRSDLESLYHLTKEVAAGNEFDPDEAEAILRAVNMADDTFEDEVRTMEENIVLAKQVKQKRELDKQLPTLQAKLESAQLALNAAVAELQPAINAAYDELKQAEQTTITLSYAEPKLYAQCLNRPLLKREAEATAELKELFEKRQPVADDLHRAKACLNLAELKITDVQFQLKKHPNYKPGIIEARAETRKAKEEKEKYEDLVAQLQSAVDEIDAEIAPLQRELQKIRAEKLVP